MHLDRSRTRAILVGLSVAFLWSPSWVLIKIGLKEIPAVTFAGLRYSLASVCLLAVLLVRNARSRIRLPPRHLWPALIGLGVLLYGCTQGAMFLALSYMPAVSVNLLWSFSAIAISLFGMIWLGERPTTLQWVGVGIATGGAVLYYYPAGIEIGQRAGLLMCGIGVLANAGGAILGRSINRSRLVSPLVVTTISVSIGSGLLLPIGIVFQGFPPIAGRGWLIIAWLAVMNTAVAFTLWNHTLRVLTATESSVINGTMLLWIPIVAVVFLGEKVGLKEIIALILVGIGTLAVQAKRFIRSTPAGSSAEERNRLAG